MCLLGRKKSVVGMGGAGDGKILRVKQHRWRCMPCETDWVSHDMRLFAVLCGVA